MKAIAILCLLSVVQVVRAEPAEFHIALQGRWSGTAIDGTKVSYSFTKEGNVTWYVDDLRHQDDLRHRDAVRPGRLAGRLAGHHEHHAVHPRAT